MKKVAAPGLRPTLIVAFALLSSLVLNACGDATSTPGSSPATSPVAFRTTPASIAAATTATVTTAPAASAVPATTTAPATGFNPGALTGLNIKISDTLKIGVGVDKDKKIIKIGTLVPLSGPVGPFGKVNLAGLETYVKALNDAGGLGGYKLELVTGDTAYQPQQAVQQYAKIAPEVAMLGLVYGTPIVQALKENIRNDQLLASASTYDSTIAQEKYIYLQATPYPIEAINGIDYAVRTFDGKSKKFALVYQDDGYGADVRRGYNAAIKAFGLTDVGQLPFKVGDAVFTSQLIQLKSAGADIVMLASQPSDTGKIIATAEQTGNSLNFLLLSPAFNVSLFNTPAKDLLVNKSVLLSKGAPWGDTAAPGFVPMLAAVAKYIPDQKPDATFTYGWSQGVIIANILGKALQQGDITREGLLKALESSKNIELGGIFANVSYGSTPDERLPTRETTVFKFDPTARDGTVPVSKPFASDAAKAYKLGS